MANSKVHLGVEEDRGQFYREIGKRENGRPVRFYLGADENQALARVSRLEALWNGVVTWWNDLERRESRPHRVHLLGRN